MLNILFQMWCFDHLIDDNTIFIRYALRQLNNMSYVFLQFNIIWVVLLIRLMYVTLELKRVYVICTKKK